MKFLSSCLAGSLVLGMALAPSVSARQSQEAFQEKYEKKLSKDFIEFGGWMTDYDAARARAKEEGKLMFVYFSRSYSP
jgi:hypothetical protein